MDFVEDEIKSEFVFNNPNAKVINFIFKIRDIVDAEKVFTYDFNFTSFINYIKK
jgi:hypothetical protein